MTRPMIARVAVVLRPNESTVPPMTNSRVTIGTSGASAYATKPPTSTIAAKTRKRPSVSQILRIQFGMCMIVVGSLGPYIL